MTPDRSPSGNERSDATPARVALTLHPEAVLQADELAALTDRTRAEVLRDCITWGLAREHAWRERNARTQQHRQWLSDDQAERLRRVHERHPERFDNP